MHRNYRILNQSDKGYDILKDGNHKKTLSVNLYSFPREYETCTKDFILSIARSQSFFCMMLIRRIIDISFTTSIFFLWNLTLIFMFKKERNTCKKFDCSTNVKKKYYNYVCFKWSRKTTSRVCDWFRVLYANDMKTR